jgi:cytidylate kinase
MNVKRLTIAIDGPAAAGKGVLARRLGAHLGLAHLDTGGLYRAAALRLVRDGGDPGDQDAAAAAAAAVTGEDLADPGLRDEAVAGAASVVAAYPGVRAALRDYQRRFAAAPPGEAAGAVLDGRDIGTVILPDADIKIFVTASPQVRAERRHKELRAKGLESIRSEILQDMQERDARDRARAMAPMVPAPDAFLLDTTDLDEDAAFGAALAHVSARRVKS